jgi:hypothetical protein
MTRRAFLPIEPVEPSIAILLVIYEFRPIIH